MIGRPLNHLGMAQGADYVVIPGNGPPCSHARTRNPKLIIRHTHFLSLGSLQLRKFYWQMGRAIFHKSVPNLMIPLQSLRMRAAPAVAQAVRTQRKISAARSSSARNRTVGRKTPRLSERRPPMRTLPPLSGTAQRRARGWRGGESAPARLTNCRISCQNVSSCMRIRPIDGQR